MIGKDASRVVGDSFRVHFPWLDDEPVRLAITEVQSELTKELQAAEEVEAKVCAHVYEDGIGTIATGYAKPENGPFCCINCEHVSVGGTRCDHPEVIKDKDVKKDGKLAVVQPLACCNEFRPKGE